MAKPPGTQLTPWTYQADDIDGRVLRVTVDFDNVTRALTGATIYRDAGCRYSRILFGLGADSKPDSTVRKFAVATGTTVITTAQLSSGGLTVIEDILAGQVTAGP